MATPQIHVRSISLPTSLHPTNVEVELQKLKSAFPKAVPILSSEAIQSGLVSLAELYNSVDELTRSSSHHLHAKSMEDSLIDGSIELLDTCSSIRELFQMIKENVQSLQSAFRRKGLDSGIQSDVATYVCSRKKMNKCVAKTLKALKNLEQYKKIGSYEDSSFIRVLREVRGVTITILKSILMFLSCPMAKSNGGWSLVISKMMITKSMDNSVNNEVGCVDFALNAIKNGDSKVIDVQKRLQNLHACIEGIKEGLERLFRQLVRTRVTILNILTDL